MGRFVAQLVGGKKMDTIHARMSAPFAEGRGERLLRDALYPGIARQFEEEQGRQGARIIAWPKTKPFGRRQPPAKTLTDKGRYKRAWTGGAGSVSAVSDNVISFGVDRSTFPQVTVFQAKGPTTIRAKKRGKSGRLAMQMKLGMEFGVWASESRLLRGFVNRPRPVGIGEDMNREARRLLAKMLVTP